MQSFPEPVHWSELTPDVFRRRREAHPLVYLPLGLCEPHGPTTPLGLDLIKADRLCAASARIHGGIVAPPLGFHIHECGPSARWLHDQVGETEPHLSSIGPTALSHLLCHQLRAAANASFAGALVVSGHAGAHAADLARLTDSFAARFGFPCAYVTDFELARPAYEPDHAGKYELSLLWHLRPDLIDRAPASLPPDTPPAKRFALGADVNLADREWGSAVFAYLVAGLGRRARSLVESRKLGAQRLTFADADAFWRKQMTGLTDWACAKPRENQAAVPAGSRWKTEERLSRV